MSNLFSELKRRNVFRVVGVYAVVSWLVAQIAALSANSFAAPDWVMKMVIVGLLIGIPIIIVFAWAFEMTPEGVKRTESVEDGDSITGQTGRKLDFAILGGLVLVAALVVGSRFMPQKTSVLDVPDAVVQVENAAPVQTQNSIAVLPFVNMSSDPEQEYFSDGISEELLNVLAQIKGLEVAGRTSSFSFKGKNQDLREIGELLNVAHILEGSVRKSGVKVRITAQLIRADNGFHLWSATYDRELTDIFAVQDEISNAILTEMREFLPGAGETIKPTARVDISAYDLYLLAREKITQGGTAVDYAQAVELLDRSIAIDANYPPAMAWRAYAAAEQVNREVLPAAEGLLLVKSYSDKALAIDPNSVEGLFALASYYGGSWINGEAAHLQLAIQNLRKVVIVQPSLTQASNDLAYFLLRTGTVKDAYEAVEILDDVLARDPGLAHANFNFINAMADRGMHSEVEIAVTRWRKMKPDFISPVEHQARLLRQRGQLANALEFLPEQITKFPKSFRLVTEEASNRYLLSDSDTLLANKIPFFQAVGLMLDGKEAEAIPLLQTDQRVQEDVNVAMISLVPAMFASRDYEGLTRFYEERLNTPALREDIFECGCLGLAYIAYSLREAGHIDADTFVREWQDYAEKWDGWYENASWFVADKGWRAELGGDAEAANQYFERAVEMGYRNPLLLRTEYHLPTAVGIPFASSGVNMLAAINAERAKLDMEPLVLVGGD